MPEKHKHKNMQLKVSVISDRPDEYIGKKGLVKSQIITCQDVDPSGYRLLMPFDYTLNEEEKTKWAGKLQDKQIVIGRARAGALWRSSPCSWRHRHRPGR